MVVSRIPHDGWLNRLIHAMDGEVPLWSRVLMERRLGPRRLDAIFDMSAQSCAVERHGGHISSYLSCCAASSDSLAC